jgi:hypothetical protein
MVYTYCGNNRANLDLVSGKSVLGTRYKCMRKGIGMGLYLPYDAQFGNHYEPIDNTKVYCGNSDDLPIGYDRMGNLPNCLQKGVGVGKLQKAKKRILKFEKYTVVELRLIAKKKKIKGYYKMRKKELVRAVASSK